jgi:hypothetical protein
VGWGPGNTWSAHLSAAKPSELRLGERGVGDAHNIIVESAVTTGAVGLAAFLALVGLTIRRMRHGPRSIGWAVGAVAGLGVSHLLQPMSISLTPLLFLLAGMAGPSPPEVEAERLPRPRFMRRAGGALVAAAAIGLTGLLLVASMLEAHGVRYGEEWALRAATRMAPQRITAAEALALHLAFDGRAGDADAAREARDLAAATVRRHPLDPGVRLAAADVHVLLRDPQGAALWKARHRALFGGDPALRDGGRDPARSRP